MQWNFIGNGFRAVTDFGVYLIKAGAEGTIDLSFSRGKDVLMTGNHPTVARAQIVAEEDNAYRCNVWETL